MQRRLGGLGHLLYFTSLQLIMYSDRSVLAGLVASVQQSFNLDDTRSGFLGSGFMGGFILMSPFVAMARGRNIPRVIGLSLLIWMMAEAVTCFARSYELLLAARIIAGAGEAGFCAMAPSMIDDTAPSAKRSLFVAIYYSAVVVGAALGFVATAPFTDWEQGRFIFLGLAALMAPYSMFILLCGDRFHASFASKDELQSSQPSMQCEAGLPGGSSASSLRLSFDADALQADGQVPSLHYKMLQPVCDVLSSGMFVFLTLGFASSQLVLGGFTFWASDYLQENLALSKAAAGIALGSMSIIIGIFGTASGGALLDVLTRRAGERWNCDADVRGVVGCRLLVTLSMLFVPAACLAASMTNAVAFLVFLGGGQLICSLGGASVVISTLESVPKQLRTMAMALSTFGGHLLGDVFSPTLVGKVADATGSLRGGMMFLAAWSVWLPVAWSVAYCVASRRLKGAAEGRAA